LFITIYSLLTGITADANNLSCLNRGDGFAGKKSKKLPIMQQFTADLATLNRDNVEIPPISEIALNSEFVALTDDNTLISFDPTNPGEIDSIAVSGVDGVLFGIDTRPANGLIYGITTANNIYTIDAESGAATYVSTLNLPFTGGTISGLDFNPVADRLRLVGDNDQNFRINVDTGEVTADGTLAFAEGDTNYGVNPNITAAAYTNSFDGTDSTQLYNLDTLLNDLVLQNPPNDGTLVTVGDLGIDLDTLSGFEIVSSPNGDNTAFAVADGTLYNVDLDLGMAFSLGEIGTDARNLQGLAVVSGDNDGDSLSSEEAQTLPEVAAPLIDLSELGDSTINFTVSRDSGFNNTVGFYTVDAAGNIIDSESGETIAVGDEDYTATAIANRSDLSLNGVNGVTSTFTTELAGGSTYAPFIVVDGTIEQLEDGSSNDPLVYFPFLEANSDGAEHVRSLGDNILGFEDLPNGGNLSFDDLTVEYDFA
jgi:sorbitol-specific phosphotransferase system component IIA